MMEFYKHEVSIMICVLIFSIFIGVFAGLYHLSEIKSHEYLVTSSSGKTYYIDDYTIEDGSIFFTIDGVEYHFSDYSIQEIEK